MIPYEESGTYLFRFMDHRSTHFWTAITEILSEQKLFLNSRVNFNDPFDSQPTVKDDIKTSAIRQHLDDMIKNPFNPNRTSKSIAQILRFKSQGKTHLNKKQIDNVKRASRANAFEYLDKCGLLSFSLTPENPLLWGHYAASFMGVCVVFKRGDSISSALSICARVAYVEKRPQLPLSLLFKLGSARMADKPIDDLANEVFFRSFLHKDGHWEHEEEARIFFPFSAYKKIQFHQNELIAIITGPKSPPELIDRLKYEIHSRYSALALHQATLSQTDFRIVIPHKYLRARGHDSISP